VSVGDHDRVRPEIIAFLRFKPELLNTADATSDANAWPWAVARKGNAAFLSGTSEFEA
jgi:hypothetical protein